MRGAEILFTVSLAGFAFGMMSLFRSKDMSSKFLSTLVVVVSIGGVALALFIDAGIVP